MDSNTSSESIQRLEEKIAFLKGDILFYQKEITQCNENIKRLQATVDKLKDNPNYVPTREDTVVRFFSAGIDPELVKAIDRVTEIIAQKTIEVKTKEVE